MLPIHAPLVRHAAASRARSALPDAPVLPLTAPVRPTATRRALAGSLRLLADRLAPEPVERSRWQSV